MVAYAIEGINGGMILLSKQFQKCFLVCVWSELGVLLPVARITDSHDPHNCAKKAITWVTSQTSCSQFYESTAFAGNLKPLSYTFCKCTDACFMHPCNHMHCVDEREQVCGWAGGWVTTFCHHNVAPEVILVFGVAGCCCVVGGG